MKLVLVLGVLVGVLLVQAHAVPEAVDQAFDQAVGLKGVDAGDQNDAVESSDNAPARRKRKTCAHNTDCAGFHCFRSIQIPYCNFAGQCKCRE